MLVVVAGVNGFVGKHLANQLLEQGHRVIGLGYGLPDDAIKNKLVSYFECDLCDEALVQKLPIPTETKAVINLAGFAKVGVDKTELDNYLRVNSLVHTNLIKRLASQKFNPRYIAVSTAAVYDGKAKMPLTEESETISKDAGVYALSKIKMEKEILRLGSELSSNVIIARPFNHVGPGQQPGFLIPDLTEQIISSKESSQPIKVGNLKTKRDYTDVRDVVSAYIALIEAKILKHSLYNICSGKSHSGEEILSHLLKLLQYTNTTVEVDSAKIRNNDISEVVGSNERIRNEISWSPKITFSQTLADFVEWRLAQ